MRIGYFTNQYPAPSHTFIRREIIALESKGHDVRRYAIRRCREELADADDRLEARKTFHIQNLGAFRILVACARTALKHPLGTLKAFFTALGYARVSERSYLHHFAYFAEAAVLADRTLGDQIEHIHVHFGTNSATVAAIAREISRIPFSFTVHGPEEFDRPQSLALGRKISAATFVVAVSSFGRSQLMRWAEHRDWSKLHVVHCGIDAHYRAANGPSVVDVPRLVCVARLAPQKGHMILLEAAAKLQSEGARFELVIAGGGPSRTEIEGAIDALSLRDAVRLTGWVSQERVRDEIAGARAMVLPSFAEGLPVVLMECMALNRPAIATYIAGVPELVLPENGWLVPAGDPDALAHAMRKALEATTSELSSMGAAARRRALERHDIVRSAELLEGLISSAVDARRRSPTLRRTPSPTVATGNL